MKQKKLILIYPLLITGFMLMLSTGCKKDKKTDDPTPTPTTVKDVDGNEYHTITIGTQVWMVENLKTTKYNDGSDIPLVTDKSSWSNLKSPGYCWYENDASTYKSTYGAIYNWYVVNTGKLCPSGWHVPTDTEWNTLATYLGESVAGGKLKESGTTHWLSPNTGATNTSGFTALPGGSRNGSGTFYNINLSGSWWTATAFDVNYAYYRGMSKDASNLSLTSDGKECGCSVRCIKD